MRAGSSERSDERAGRVRCVAGKNDALNETDSKASEDDASELGEPGADHLADRVHQHLVCEECGSVTEVPPAAFRGLERALKRDYGFTIKSRHFAVAGSCQACTQAAAAVAAMSYQPGGSDSSLRASSGRSVTGDPTPQPDQRLCSTAPRS